MKKIQDRVQLGIISGLAGVFVKNLVGTVLVKTGLAEEGAPQRAAGMLLPAYNVAAPLGRAAGWMADAAVGCLLGIASVYVLSFTGKDRAPLKGLTTGALAWVGLYGVLGNMGATNVRTALPRTVLSEFIGHSVFGLVSTATAAFLGDEDLLTAGMPRNAATIRLEVPYSPSPRPRH